MNTSKIRHASRVSFLVLILLGFPIATAIAGILHSTDFEHQQIDGDGINTTALCCNHSAAIVSQPVQGGDYAAKVRLNSNDAGTIFSTWQNPAKRAELRWYNTGFKVGSERWYGLAVYVDPSWQDNTNDPNGTILVQWHGPTDSGESAHSPQLSLRITRDNRWHLITLYDSSPKSTSKSPTKISRNLGPVTKGVWVNWVIHAKWHYNSTGLLEAWKDGVKVVNYTGPNTFNDQTQVTFSFGIYKSWYQVEQPSPPDTLIVYYDEIKVGDHNSSYAEIVPNPLTSPWGPSPPTNLTVK